MGVEIDRHRTSPAVVRQVFNVCRRWEDTGVAHQDIETAKVPDCLIKQGSNIARLRQITANPQVGWVAVKQFCDGVGDVCPNDTSPLSKQLLDGRQTNPECCTRYECHDIGGPSPLRFSLACSDSQYSKSKISFSESAFQPPKYSPIEYTSTCGQSDLKITRKRLPLGAKTKRPLFAHSAQRGA